MKCVSAGCTVLLLLTALGQPKIALAAQTTGDETTGEATSEAAGEATEGDVQVISDEPDLSGTIPQNISIAGTDVSGMDAAEAQAIVDAYVDSYDGVEFTLAVEDKSVEADAEDLGLCAKNADVVARALKYGQEGNILARYKAVQDMENGVRKDFAISLTTDTATTEAFLEANKEDLVTEAVDNTVKRVNGTFVYVEGTEGIALLTGKSAVAIADYIATQWDGQDATIELLTKKDEPRGTKEELATITDVLGTYSTNFGTVVNGRTNNIKVGASKLDGVVVYPGETISVEQTIGPTTEENGYFLAGSYENGTTVETYGGGICQVSTTLYNAVIRAELEIVTRAAHSMIVSYVEPSMDAAIADGVKDLQFKNNKETPVYIEGYTSGGYLYFSIYGQETRDPGRSVEFISEVTSQTDPETVYTPVADQPIGYVETTTSAHIGYTARLWKVVYQDGVEVSRDVFNNSKYNPSSAVVSVGVATDNAEAAAAMAAALETKDDATIRAAAAQWSAEGIAASQAAAEEAAAQQQATEAAAQPSEETTGSSAAETGTTAQ
jgi:vancomycin resistance protein YoaR